MNLRFEKSAVIAVLTLPQLLLPYSALSGERAFLSPYARREGSAVDAHGVRHRETDYRGDAPWLKQIVKTVAPEYPRGERWHRHQGNGMIKLALDLKTGSVVEAKLTKSTGFQTLDSCALTAFRQWRWAPGKWREVNIGVTFRIHDTTTPLPPGSVRIPAAH